MKERIETVLMEPVSYTHLDVYKRQVPYCPKCQQYRFPMYNVAVSMIVVDEETGKIPVSYTHLDVYKRQELRDETLKRLPEDIREGYELFRWNIGQR